jgi:hypothetical protein
MYTFPNKLRNIALVLMILGIAGIIFGFLTAPKTIQDVEKIVAESHHGGHHGASAHEGNHADASHAVAHEASTGENHNHNAEAGRTDEKAVDSLKEVATLNAEVVEDSASTEKSNLDVAAIKTEEAKQVEKVVEHSEAAKQAEHAEHMEHMLHQLQNKPWAALYVACIFFLLLTMGVLAFYAIQQVAQAGWSPVLFRVMQGITAYLPVISILFFVLLLLSGFHVNHLFVWMKDGVTDPNSPNYDAIIAGKSGYLNFAFWISRAAITATYQERIVWLRMKLMTTLFTKRTSKCLQDF